MRNYTVQELDLNELHDLPTHNLLDLKQYYEEEYYKFWGTGKWYPNSGYEMSDAEETAAAYLDAIEDALILRNY